MKEQVTDISKALQDMAEEMRLMRKTISQQYAEILQLNRNIESLNHQIRKKDEELSELRERLSKYEKPDKNSGNSSTPPSKERMKDEVVRRTKSLRKPSGKKPGGQHGHDGHKLSCSSTPDEPATFPEIIQVLMHDLYPQTAKFASFLSVATAACLSPTVNALYSSWFSKSPTAPNKDVTIPCTLYIIYQKSLQH